MHHVLDSSNYKRQLFDIIAIDPSYDWIVSCLHRLFIIVHILRSAEMAVPIVTGKNKSTI